MSIIDFFVMVISRSTTVGDLLQHHPESLEVLERYGLEEDASTVDSLDTIDDFAQRKKLSDEDIERMIEEINEIIANRERAEEEMMEEEDD
jgi:transcription-repair coupling factor (superfamily II helicase)